MVVNNIVGLLKNLGFSEYEAKAFTGLAGAYPATAYEIAKAAGIPTSKIYEIMEKLLAKGVILKLTEGEKTLYVPIETDEFILNYKKEVETSLKELASELAEITKTPTASYIWNMQDYRRFLNKAERIILSAKRTLLISGWRQEISLLEPAVKKSGEHKVKSAIIHFGTPEISLGQVFHHPIEDTIYAEKGGRALIIIADSQEALMGTVFANSEVEGAYSRNRGFVLLAEDYVKHDIYIMKIVKRFNKELIERFGEKYHKLRDVYSDEEVI
ncbi:MAG: TrmB family transcriptional regulator [Spirochaetales bacterium]|nr:TrmB family transcriptional regulator [Spirochaetales bacterium]